MPTCSNVLVTPEREGEKRRGRGGAYTVASIGRAAIDRESADVLYLGCADCSGDGNQKRAPTLMRALAKLIWGYCVMFRWWQRGGRIAFMQASTKIIEIMFMRASAKIRREQRFIPWYVCPTTVPYGDQRWQTMAFPERASNAILSKSRIASVASGTAWCS